MKAKTCTQCDKKTFQKDGICALCKIGLTQMYDELIDLLKKDNKLAIRTPKTAKTR